MGVKKTILKWGWMPLLALIFSTGCIPPTIEPVIVGPPTSIGGTVSGLEEGEQVGLVLAGWADYPLPLLTPDLALGSDSIVVDQNGTFTFDLTLPGTPITYYAVQIASHPDGKLCSIDNAEGNAFIVPVTNVTVNCGEPVLAGLRDVVPDSKLAECINQRAAINGYTRYEDITYIYCKEDGISDTTGLDAFANLKTLSLPFNNISSIDVSSLSNLTSLTLSYNKLLSLDVSALPNLKTLSAGSNGLVSIDLSVNTNLTSLDLYGNELPEVDLSALTKLKLLDLTHNQLSSIDVSANPDLESLRLGANKLSSIDLSANTALGWIYLGSNQFTSLDLSQFTVMHLIDVSYNNLTELDLRNLVQINKLLLRDNLLTNLNNIPLEDLLREPPSDETGPVADYMDANFPGWRDSALLDFTLNPWDQATVDFFAEYIKTTDFKFHYSVIN